jgi:hypothetical protein
VSGNHTDIERIKRQIDKTRQYHVIAQCDNPNTVAGIFKSFFRELAEPLLTFANYTRFVTAAAPDKSNSAPNDDEARVKRAEQLKSVLTRLPKENYELLLYLVSFLVKVSQSSKVNLMDSRNLSLIWGSIVLRDEHEDTSSVTALTNTSQQAAVMALLIDHYELIFKAKNSAAPVKPVNNNTPPGSMSATTNSSPSSSMASTLNPMTATMTPVNVTPVNNSTLPQTFSSPAMLSPSRPGNTAPSSAPIKTPVTGPSAPPKSRGPLPAPPPRVKAATMKTPVKTAAVKFNSVEVPSNTNRAPNNSSKPPESAAPKNSNAIPVLGAAYPVSAEKRGTVPGDGTQSAEPKSEPLRARAITAGHADKDTHVNSAPAPRVNEKTQPRAAVNPMTQTLPAPTVTPVTTAPLSAPVKRSVVPAVAPLSAVKESGPLSPPSVSAPKKTPAAPPKSQFTATASSSGPVSSPLQISPARTQLSDKTPPTHPASIKTAQSAPSKMPPTPPPRAKAPLLTSPKEPRRSYSLQTLN